MKKIIAMLLLAGLVFSLASCMGRGKDPSGSSGETTNSGNITPSANTTTAEGLLERVYEPFLMNMAPIYGVGSAEEVKSYFVGTETETVTETDEDTGEEFSYDMPKNEPGPLSLDDRENLQNQTLFPADAVDKIQNAAIFYNLMNMNNGTFSAFKVKNASDVQVLADRLRENLKTNHWICGSPERFLIMRADDVLICAYGLETSVTAWKNAVNSAYDGAQTLYEESL